MKTLIRWIRIDSHGLTKRHGFVLTPLTPLTSELAKLEFKIEYWLYFKSDSVGQTKRHKIKLIVGFNDTFAVDVIAVLYILLQGIVLVDVFSDISILAQ